MITRLRVRNFKNLEDVDVRFGPFTCIAGPNGAGKSNLFDAISFLGALANYPLMEAAQQIRGVEARGDVRSLFHRAGDRLAEQMSFLVEMIIPPTGTDELGQQAEASMTYLRYELDIGLQQAGGTSLGARLEIQREALVHIRKTDAHEHLVFPHSPKWRDSVIKGRRTSDYISTDTKGDVITIALHMDSKGGLGGGRPRRVPARNLPRTMLSSVTNAEEHQTLVLVRQEMASWVRLQLEPSALRTPDNFTAPTVLAPNGAHLPATLYALAVAKKEEEENLYANVTNYLSKLIESVKSIYVERDEKRQTLSLVMTDRQNTQHVASSLSDGTLRFLALVVLKHMPTGQRLICLEEPENGIHPQRIPPILQLLRDLAVNTKEPDSESNPLRQVIINTHSPLVVSELNADELLFLRQVRRLGKGKNDIVNRVECVPGTWRKGMPEISKGEMIQYLNPMAKEPLKSDDSIRSRYQQTKLFPSLDEVEQSTKSGLL